jgi:hypothetical protein
MKKLGCPKCHAPASALHFGREILADGTHLQTVLCILCGERASRVTPQRPTPPARPRYSGSHRCAVIDCPRPLGAHNKSGMCALHAKQLANWKHGQKTRPAPLIHLDAGRWIVNPERYEARA